VVDDPSILGLRIVSFFRFAKGTLLVLLGAGLGLYVQSTGEYLARDGQWARLGLDEPFAYLPDHVRAYVYGSLSLLTLLPGIGCAAILYFGLLTTWDLWRASRAGRLRAAGTLRLVLNHLGPGGKTGVAARLGPQVFFDLTQPMAMGIASFNVFLTAFFVAIGNS
jgi:hypothetical protein